MNLAHFIHATCPVCTNKIHRADQSEATEIFSLPIETKCPVCGSFLKITHNFNTVKIEVLEVGKKKHKDGNNG